MNSHKAWAITQVQLQYNLALNKYVLDSLATHTKDSKARN